MPAEPVQKDEYTCKPEDVPPSMTQVFNGRDTFCVVRDPYDRIIEEFRRRATGSSNCIPDLHAFVRENLRPLNITGQGNQFFRSGCRFMPQAAFVYGWQSNPGVVDRSIQRCRHILRYEQLQKDVHELFTNRSMQLLVQNQNVEDGRCPSFDKCKPLGRCLSREDRELIEHVFREDFELLGFSKLTRPVFIHIPRAGGTSIEKDSRHLELWGHEDPVLNKMMKFGLRGEKCMGQHITPAQFPEYFGGRDTFCVIRDPYKRAISQFGFQMGFFGKFECIAEDLNKYLELHLPFHKNPGSCLGIRPYESDCHFLPQSAYVYEWNTGTCQIDHTKRWCMHVLRFDHLHEDVNSFFRDYGYPMRLLQEATRLTRSTCRLKPQDLSAEVNKSIEQIYADDFQLLREASRLRTFGPAPLRTQGH